MAPRRPRSSSNVSATVIPRAPTASPQLKKQFALSIDSIYNNNMTVLKRRDPSILSIVDQFSHVCLYHFNGKKWEKSGFEGSMFLVDHQQYPPYGLYILNRMGTGDYQRPIYPEDDMEVLGDYLMYRYYPDYTRKRLAMGLPYPLPPQFRPAFDEEFARDNSAPPDAQETPQDSKKEKKGTSVTLGLWMFPTDAREPLKDVMLRLHSYIQRGEAYPEEYRYGPGRPPPPNPHLRRATQSPLQGFDGSPEARLAQDKLNHAVTNAPTFMSTDSEVDRLFAKLQQPHSSSVPPAEPAQTQPLQVVPDWFATLTGQAPAPQNGNNTGSTVSFTLGSHGPAPAPPVAARGLALLDTIFASVAQPTTNPPQNGAPQDYLSSRPAQINQAQPGGLPPHPEEIQIVSPKPQSSALPQILNQDVIASLLGLSPNSRSSSAAPSSSSSRRSTTHRYEGDNELSENDIASEGGFSTSSTILEPNGAQRAAPSARVVSASVQGDVTPKAFPQETMTGRATPLSTAQVSTTVTSTTTVPTSSTPSGTKPQRTLVPFSSDSDLWPYPRAPVNDNDARSNAEGDAEDVVELDFSDTRALSDPNMFKAKQQKRRRSKKEKAAEREKERAAIEQGWDDPTKGQVTIPGSETQTSITSSATSGMNGHGSSMSIASTYSEQSLAQSRSGLVNGAVSSERSGSHTPNGLNGTSTPSGTSAEYARIALLSALGKYPKAPSRELSRKQFVQEVLGLIYSDNAFVDRLYQEYTTPSS